VNEDAREFITMAGDNLFADMGFPDADELLIKAQLMQRIQDAIKARGWTQARAAKALELAQPEVSHLMRGHISRFTIDRLVKAANALGTSVRVSFENREFDTPRPSARKRTSKASLKDAAGS
jgi:predicted XRE-type DNA-binding protein